MLQPHENQDDKFSLRKKFEFIIKLKIDYNNIFIYILNLNIENKLKIMLIKLK